MVWILEDRAVLKVNGADAFSFLQGLITKDMQAIEAGSAHSAVMLSPQGKLAHDFFLYTHEDGYFVDVDAEHATALLKKLKLYKMRSDVSLSDVSGEYSVSFALEEIADAVAGGKDARGLGYRTITQKDSAANAAEYHAWRITQGMPEAAKDGTDRSFVLDLGYDALGAVDFDKGCYVGQEVTARMHYKNARRRLPFVLIAETSFSAEKGAEITQAGKKVGDIRSTNDAHAIAVCAADTPLDQPVSVDGVDAQISVPSWFSDTYQALKEQAEKAE